MCHKGCYYVMELTITIFMEKTNGKWKNMETY
jgi:hypothetical protein